MFISTSRLRWWLQDFPGGVTLFLTKVHARVLRPGLQALDLSFTAQVPPALCSTFTALDRAVDAHIAEAQIAA